MAKLSLPVSERDHSQGNLSASLTLVEYGDYECLYCGAAYPVVKQVQHRFASLFNALEVALEQESGASRTP